MAVDTKIALHKSVVDSEAKEDIMNAVLSGTLRNVQHTLESYNLVQDESFFDYELLKLALKRKHRAIANYLILKKRCRVRNPNKNNSREETPLHLAMELNSVGFIQKLLIRGASIYDKNRAGDVPIYSAFKKGYLSAIEDLLRYCCRSKQLNPNDKVDILHFHIACVVNDISSVNIFLTAGFDANSSLSILPGKYQDLNATVFSDSIFIDSGMTPLHFAAFYDFEEMVKLLLDNGANSNKVDQKGRTPLHSAILGQIEFDTMSLKIITMLFEKKCRLDVADKNGSTPLHLAFYYGHNEHLKNVFEMLLSNVHWGPTNETNDEGLSYFHIACTTNDVQQVKEFLNSGVDINKPVTSGVYSGFTPLHFAVLHNQKNVVQLLLKSGAQVNVVTAGMLESPLHLACQYNYVKFHDLYSKFDSARENNKATCIDWASIGQKQLDIIKLLLSHGANKEKQDFKGKTPILHAGMLDFCQHCELNWSDPFKEMLNDYLSCQLERIIKVLLSEKTNANSLANDQSTLLHILSEHHYFKISDNFMKYLLDHGLCIEAVDDTEQTPLHIAVKSINKHMVQMLLKYNANVNAETDYFLIPLEIAIMNYSKHLPEKKDIICTLLEYGSEVNINMDEDQTLLNEAITTRNIFVLSKLLQYGADINFESESFKSSVSGLYKWRKALSSWKDIKYATIFQIVYTHVQKLLALGLHVSNKVLKCCQQLYSSYEKSMLKHGQLVNLDNIFDECVFELNDMKNIKIDHYTSLYSILLKDAHAVSKHVRNSSFINIVNDPNIDEKFPFYGYLLKLQFKKGLVRDRALISAQSSLNHALGFSLPDNCCDLIIKYLTDEDVANLKIAVL